MAALCESKILDGYLAFAMKLYGKTGQGDDKNFLISPYSFALSFSMLCDGTKQATESELKSLIKCSDLSNDSINKNSAILIDYINKITTNNSNSTTLKLLNKILLNNGINVKNDFQESVRKIYKSDLGHLEFENVQQTAKQLNEWLDSLFGVKFQRHISSEALPYDARMVLLNAVYFRGNWMKKFEKRLTMRDKFFLMNGSTTTVQMMTLYGRKFKYQSTAAELNAAVLELPYIDNLVSMTIILPHKDTDLVAIESQLKPDVLKDLLESYNFLTKVNVHIPKFRMENNLELSETLRSMGATHVFKPFRTDFTGITDDANNLFISKAIHKTIIEVDEDGAESQAANNNECESTTWCKLNAFTDPVAEFRCNRPFLFVLHDNQYRIPLLIGKYARPE